jgi:hypothetical protein
MSPTVVHVHFSPNTGGPDMSDRPPTEKPHTLHIEAVTEGLEDGRITALYVAEHLSLQSGAPGRIHPSDYGPYESRTGLSIVLAQLALEEREPDPLECPLAG